MGYSEDSPTVWVWSPLKPKKVLNVGAAEFDEGVGRGWWMGGLGEGSLPGMETVEFPDVEGDGDLPAGDGEGAGPPAFPGGPAGGVQPPAGDGAGGENSEDFGD